MQAEHMPIAHDEIRERSKLEGKHIEGEEEHASQPSTIQSLGSIEEHPQGQKTSTPSKFNQLGNQIKHGAQTQVNYIKTMLSHVFGEKVDPSRDNDQATKAVLKKVNEEIRTQPKRNERVIESEGKCVVKEGRPRSFSSQAFEKINVMRDKIAQHMPQIKSELNHLANAAMGQLGQIKQKFIISFGERVNPAKDLDDKTKENLYRLNQDVRQIPRREEYCIETKGHGKIKEDANIWGDEEITGYWF